MSRNLGPIDRIIRIVIGAALLYFALFASQNGYNWLGWIGVVPIITALMGYCPLYAILGVSTFSAKRAS